MRTNPFYDAWLFLIGGTSDQGFEVSTAEGDFTKPGEPEMKTH